MSLVGFTYNVKLTSTLLCTGSAEVLVSSLEVGQEVEKWYPITLVGTKGTGNEGPSMRIKIKYQVRIN